MSIGLNRRRRLAVLVLAILAVGAIWAISASARVSPIKDSFRATGTIQFRPESAELALGHCTLDASGTMPASGSVITASTVTFTSCKNNGGGKEATFSVTSKTAWTFTLAWGLPATATVSIPYQGIIATSVKGGEGSCKWTNETFTSSAETWENGVSEKEKEAEGAVLTKSESAFSQVMAGEYEAAGGGCELNNLQKVRVFVEGPLIWEDLTHTKQAILNGN